MRRKFALSGGRGTSTLTLTKRLIQLAILLALIFNLNQAKAQCGFGERHSDLSTSFSIDQVNNNQNFNMQAFYQITINGIVLTRQYHKIN